MQKYFKFNLKATQNETDNKCSLEIAPLNKGVGVSLGNLFRRFLLLNTNGAAMCAVEIENVVHEFSTLNHVTEATNLIILNLRKIIFSLDFDIYPLFQITKVLLQNAKAGKIYAKDLIVPTGVKIINPDCYIATINKDNALKLKISVCNGFSFHTHEENKQYCEHGTIATDSDYSPVTNVNYRIEKYQISKDRIAEKLFLEVTTNGSVSAKTAIGDAAVVINKHIEQFQSWSQNEDPETILATSFEEEAPEDEIFLTKPIEHLNLTVRCYNSLKGYGIKLISELAELEISEIKTIKNLGPKSLAEIKDKFNELNLKFGTVTKKPTNKVTIDEEE